MPATQPSPATVQRPRWVAFLAYLNRHKVSENAKLPHASRDAGMDAIFRPRPHEVLKGPVWARMAQMGKSST